MAKLLGYSLQNWFWLWLVRLTNYGYCDTANLLQLCSLSQCLFSNMD